jgi:hypothetical protein
MKRRLQQLKRPNRVEPAIGNPSATDRALADKGLVTLRESYNQIGCYVTQLTLLGSDAVEADEYEYCGCGSLTHTGEAACLDCGRTKGWAQ